MVIYQKMFPPIISFKFAKEEVIIHQFVKRKLKHETTPRWKMIKRKLLC